jgi:hypothetical protein
MSVSLFMMSHHDALYVLYALLPVPVPEYHEPPTLNGIVDLILMHVRTSPLNEYALILGEY